LHIYCIIQIIQAYLKVKEYFKQQVILFYSHLLFYSLLASFRQALIFTDSHVCGITYVKKPGTSGRGCADEPIDISFE